MRAAAIFGPAADLRHLRPFHSPGVELVTAADLPPLPGYDAALIFGGDGSAHRQLSAAVASQAPILCVPTGSGNDFARALGLAKVRDALAAWKKFCAGANNVRQIDVAEANVARAPGPPARADVAREGVEAPSPASEEPKSRLATHNSQLATQNSLYCCVAGAGLDSEVNRRANLLPSWLRGHGGYALSLAPALTAFRAPEISVELFDSDGPARISEPAMMVAVANAPCYGKGMRIAPRARLDDGKLDVCFVRRASKLRLLRLFPVVYSGGHLRLPEVVYAQCSGLRITSEPPQQIYGDGEFIGWTPAEIRVLPRALRVIVP